MHRNFNLKSTTYMTKIVIINYCKHCRIIKIIIKTIIKTIINYKFLVFIIFNHINRNLQSMLANITIFQINGYLQIEFLKILLAINLIIFEGIKRLRDWIKCLHIKVN